MLTLRPGSLAYRLISMLSVTGEYPIHSLHLLGNPRVMRDLVRRMSEPQLVRLPGADSVQTKLVQISGKGAAKSVRLYRGALPILEWMHPDAFDYPNNLWAEILGNTDVQLMLGCTDDISAEYFSARSGDMSIQINTTMTVRQTLAVAQMIPQYRHTEGQGKRRLLTPDEVLRLPNEELLVIIRGHNVLKLNKLDYTRLPMAAQIEKRSRQRLHNWHIGVSCQVHQ